MNTITQITALLVVVALSSSSVVQSPSAKGDNFELLILHNNDMHARFEQTSQLSGTCTAKDREAGKCYGGFPRVAYVVKQAREAAASGQGPPVLYLNAGDTYTGTAWFTIYKWKIAAEFINALQPDAVSLGNNDLNTGPNEPSPFLNNINSPILASNVILSNEKDNKNIQKSLIFNIQGRMVGLLGFLTPENNVLDGTINIEYVDEVIALSEEAKRLQEQGVNIIIAIGHASVEKNIEIAKEVEGIDLIISGNENTYYWNGNNVGTETPLEEPIVIVQESGKRVLILQSQSYDKYLGRADIKFDSDGELVDYTADPVLLDTSVAQDAKGLELVSKYHEELTTFSEEVVGQTAVVLDGESCKTAECNLGNLIADAIMYYYAIRYEGETWTDAAIAFVHGGAIFGSIAPSNRPAPVTRGDLLSALPLQSNIVAVTMTGAILNQVLEHSVANYSISNPTGQLLQFSGIRAVYDISKEPGSRLVNAVARCWSCFVPESYVIDDWRTYKVLMPAALANGQFGYTMLVGLPVEELEYDEVTCLAEFISLRSPVYPDVAERISLGNHELDNGVSGLTPFIENLTCPVLAANLVLNKVPELEAEPNLMKSVIFDVNGTKVGVIGYLTPDTKVLAVRNDVDYIEEVQAIKEEVKNLKQQGIKILIALGHSGFTKDLEIAREVEDIDLVIGGHTNTFLWNGTSPDIEKPEGPYPMIVKQASGRRVPAVQAYAYTKYLGKLHLVFNTDGEVVSLNGNPILLDKTVPQDPDVLAIVNRYSGEVKKVTELVVGTTSVVLDGNSCRLRECNMGNLIADAMIYKYASEYTGYGWSDAPIAVIQGGGIRASVVHMDMPANVTKGDLLTVMPFDGSMSVVTVQGETVWKMLEHAVAYYNTKRAVAKFLQLSGLRVEYDFAKPPGRRVLRASVRCGLCIVPTYSSLNRTKTYKMLMTSFLSMGGDGFSSLGNHEFDNGVSGLTPFIENLTCPVLAANLELSKVPELERETNLKNTITIDIDGTKIGVIGYLTPETKFLAVENDVEYIDEIVALKKEVANLQNEGIKIIIALGHSGYLKDIEIAKQVEGVDLVIGGHTNTFLWNGTSPDAEEIQGPYPTYVRQASGRTALVVQAYAYTKYLGKLLLAFDSEGEIVKADGQPILLDNTIPQDPDTLQIVNRYTAELKNLTDDIVGETTVVLDGLSCQLKECNLGNLIADAMFYTYTEGYKGDHWTDVPIAMIQGGGIRASIAHVDTKTKISKADLITVLPFGGNLTIVTVNGSIILEMLEHSSLGNHEFDEEVEGLVPFIHNVTIPVLAANLILDKVPELEHEPNLHKSIILLVQGVKIGVIGYLTPETKYLAPKNKVEYEEEIIAIRREVEALKKQDVKIFIALGHSGFIKDIEIAKNVEDIDLVIGGHSNTFLWNGRTNEKPEYPEGPYPTMVVQPSGRRVPVVQAYAYTKYMGRLHLVFDADGEIVKYDGTPLLLSQDVPNDKELSITIDRYRTEIDRINNEVIGSSLVGLDGICRIKECNMGNFITDAILNYTARYYPDYSDVKIAVVQGGRIRTSIDQAAKPMKILRGDLITVIPFSDTLSIVTMNGTVLKQALEHSVSTWRLIDSTGNFLQMSGIQVTYDLAEPAGSRIIDAKAACSQCGDPSISEVKDDYVYKVFMPSFLAEGGDGYVMFENLTKEVISFDELKCLFDYLGKYSPIKPEVSNRITLLNKDKLKSEPHRINNTNRLLAVPSTILSIVLLCKVLYS
ncbi:uncharacterized protein LOC114354053 [Ostrinia furnacalis]|uniref:uncharacterized protein LOC114354053 n=1 Tax=Ostrinia furnacalis TaxID=93504 RepID=UPI00104016C2|nr:uncharacterized protein LOC114354053 [Ostrinia furnacalis]